MNPIALQQNYRGHRFQVEAVGSDESWQGRLRVDFMLAATQGHTLGVRYGVPLESSWATREEALRYAAEQAYAAIDAYRRLAHEVLAGSDTGLRDPRLTVRYSLLQEDGVERQQEFLGSAGAIQFIGRLGDSLRHAFVLDAAGTTLFEAGIDDRRQREEPDHADWPQTE